MAVPISLTKMIILFVKYIEQNSVDDIDESHSYRNLDPSPSLFNHKSDINHENGKNPQKAKNIKPNHTRLMIN